GAGAARGGSGLGLAIVNAIVWAHGGRAQARRRTGGGSVFELLLPESRRLEQEDRPEPAVRAAAGAGGDNGSLPSRGEGT
ncbi:MAG TPA: ATP-binding protein, partial [Candidatus Eisenbacteria bacterium]|nr:ATP-binding protein [Candidatus Eisenbacteria bacterium]